MNVPSDTQNLARRLAHDRQAELPLSILESHPSACIVPIYGICHSFENVTELAPRTEKLRSF